MLHAASVVCSFGVYSRPSILNTFQLGARMVATHVYLLLGLAFVVGYIVGRLDFIAALLTGTHSTPHALGTPQWNAQMRETRRGVPVPEAGAKIDINETKVVLPVDTSGIKKVSDVELGRTQTVADNVNAAADRLAQLKAR